MDTKQLQLENETLNARLDKAKEVFRQQAKDIKAKDEAYLKLRDEYNELVRERDTHIEANAKLNNEINTLNKQLADTGYDREAYVGQIDALNDKVRELETQNQSISDMYNKTVAGLKIRDNEVEELRKTVAVFEEGNSNYDELQEELNTTKKALHIANETLSDFDSKCARYDEVIKSLNEKNDEITKCSMHWEDLYHKLSKTHSESSIELNMFKDRNDELEGLATARLVDINKSKEEIKKLDDTILEINTQLSEINEKHHNLVFKYDELTDEHNLLTEQFADLENEYNNSEELRKNYKEAVDKLNDEVSRLQDIIVSKDSTYKGLQDTYNDLAEEHLRDVRALNYKIEMLESEVTNKTEKLNKAYEEIGTLKNRLNAESGKVEEVKAKTEEAVTTIKKKLQALNDGLGDEFNIFG